MRYLVGIDKTCNKLTTKSPNNLKEYKDLMNHKVIPSGYISTVVGIDYYIITKQASINEESKHTVIQVYDINSHNQICTLNLAHVTGTDDYKVVKKQVCNKDILILYNEDTFILVKDVLGKPQVTTHNLKKSTNIYGKYRSQNYDAPIYVGEGIYFLQEHKVDYSYNTGKLCVAYYDLKSDEVKQFKSILLKGYEKDTKILAINSEENMLYIFSKHNKTFTKVDIVKNVIAKSSILNIPTFDYSSMNVFFKAEDKNILLIAIEKNDGSLIQVYDLAKAEIIRIININEFADEIPDFKKYEHSLRYYIHHASLSIDDSYLMMMISNGKSKVAAIYELESQTVALSLDLKINSGFPQYLENKLMVMKFSPDAILEIRSKYDIIHVVYNNYYADDMFACTSYSKSNKVFCMFRSNKIKVFDFNRFKLNEILTDQNFDEINTISKYEQDGILITLCQNKSRYPEKNIIFSYDTNNNEIVDQMDISSVSIYGSGDGDFKHPAIKVDEMNSASGYIITTDISGKLELIRNESKLYGIKDLNEKYIVRGTRDKQKIYIYDRQDIPITTIILKQQFYRVDLSEKEDCINIFYSAIGDDNYHFERYNIKKYEKGFRSAEVELSIGEIHTYEFSYNFKESCDGRFVYYLKGTDDSKTLTGYDTKEQNIVLRKPFNHNHADIIKIEDNMNYIAFRMGFLGSNFKLYKPFNMELLAEISIYNDNKFLIATYSDNKRMPYFYTNSPEMINVYNKDYYGNQILLEKSDDKRKEYLKLYNSNKKVRDIILSPEKFEEDEKMLSALTEMRNLTYICSKESYILNE